MFGPSPIRFSCPSCGTKLQATADSAGFESNCPSCGGQIVTPSASRVRIQNLVANGLALIGILALASVTSEGIERAHREREIQVLESPDAGSAGAPAAAAAGETDTPQVANLGQERKRELPTTPSAAPVLPARPPGASPEPSQGNDSATADAALADNQAAEEAVEDAGSTASDPFASTSDRPVQPTTSIDLAEARSELEKVAAEIESERLRWKDALGVINSLTANKTRPVREGSAAYHRCMEASKIVQEVETEAPALKARKAQLEERIKALEK